MRARKQLPTRFSRKEEGQQGHQGHRAGLRPEGVVRVQALVEGDSGVLPSPRGGIQPQALPQTPDSAQFPWTQECGLPTHGEIGGGQHLDSINSIRRGDLPLLGCFYALLLPHPSQRASPPTTLSPSPCDLLGDHGGAGFSFPDLTFLIQTCK